MTKKNTAAETIMAYKAFGPDWKCRDFQYAPGETYEHAGRVKACDSGFHACENPLDVLNYYDLCDSKFATVELSGEISRHGDDSKIAGGRITVKAELGLPKFIGAAVEYLLSLAKGADGEKVQAASGDSSKLAASGNSSKLAASGDSSKLAASGDSSKLAASGKSSIAMAAATNCTAKAGELGCIALTRWVEAEKRYRVSVAYVGEDGIEPDTFYTLDENGKFVKA
ncbi:hypothetical protein J7E70_08030 [Variovorax paradoxus]|nr:hypothetical protein [Variovorax paradoxus]MBT2300412.1 hypothetical protein [Variovorax paradoxus]